MRLRLTADVAPCESIPSVVELDDNKGEFVFGRMRQSVQVSTIIL